jgi:putative ABC transport system permease protein
MKKINRMIMRDIRQSAGQYIAAAAVAVLGVMMYMGINSIFRNLDTTRKEYYEAYRFEHLEVTGSSIPSAVVDRVRNIPGVKLADGRVVSEARIEFEEPQRAVTPGQAVVFYDGDIVVGGGVIKKKL